MDQTTIEALRAEAVTAEAVTAEAVQAGAPADLPPVVDPVQEAKALFATVVALAAPLLPYLPGIYTDDRLDMLAAAYVPVATKYGWDVGGWLGNYSAEIALAAVAAPLAMATAKAHREHVAAMVAAKAPKKPEALPPQAPPPAADGKLPVIEREIAADGGGMLKAA